MATTILPGIAQTYVLKSGGMSGIMLGGLDKALKPFRSQGSENIVVLDDISYNDKDVILPVVALDDQRLLYSFGKNFGEASIIGTIYNGCNDKPKFSAVDAVERAFQQYRVSATQKPVSLSVVGGFKAMVYIVSIDILQAEPAIQSIKFRINCLVAPVRNKG